jgi:hypothetical protein
LKEPVEVPKQIKAVPIVTKVEEKQSDSGKHITYLDNHDSVKIFIEIEQPAQKQNAGVVLKEPKKEVTDSQVLKEDKAVVPVVATVDKTTRSEDIKKPEEIKKNEEIKKPDETKKTELKEDPPPKPVEKEVKDTAAQQKKMVIYNSDCKAIAWDNDVDKLRIKMLGAKDVDDKITIARKIFKTKCFTAAQIKGLTELFVTDQDKYKFLDAAYPFALDTENFKQLSYLLTDDYYVKRFRTMVRID